MVQQYLLFNVKNHDGTCRYLNSEHTFLELCVLEVNGTNAVGVLKVIIVSHVVAGEDASAYSLCLCTFKSYLHFLWFSEAYIRKREDDAAVGLLCC